MNRITRTLVLAAASVGIAAGAVAGATHAGATDVPDRYQVMARELAPVAKWANQNGLSGLSPASMHPVAAARPAARPTKAPRDVFAEIPTSAPYSRDIFAN